MSFNLKALDVIAQRIEELSRKEVSVGWFESAMYDEGTPVASVAATQEFGAPAKRIPPRPFIVPTVEANRDLWAKKMEQGAQAVMRDAITPEGVLNVMGQLAAGQMQNAIRNVTSPELSPVTILLRKWRREGRKINDNTVAAARSKVASGTADLSGVPTDPLRDTGLMLASLTHIVRDKTE